MASLILLVSNFQSLREWSMPQDMILSPFMSKSADKTSSRWPSTPPKMAMQWSVLMFQSLKVWSLDTDSSKLGSLGWNLSSFMHWNWILNVKEIKWVAFHNCLLDHVRRSAWCNSSLMGSERGLCLEIQLRPGLACLCQHQRTRHRYKSFRPHQDLHSIAKACCHH